MGKMEETWIRGGVVDEIGFNSKCFHVVIPGQERRIESRAVTELSIRLSSDLPRPQWM